LRIQPNAWKSHARALLLLAVERLKAQILEFDTRIIAWHRSNAASKRLDAILGVGPALAASKECRSYSVVLTRLCSSVEPFGSREWQDRKRAHALGAVDEDTLDICRGRWTAMKRGIMPVA